MKLLFDLAPVVLFFLTYKLASKDGTSGSCAIADPASALPLLQEPILLATAVAIGATVLQVAWLLLRRRPVDPMLWISFAIVTLFGGATLYFRDPTFIQWKPSILYWLFSLILAGSTLFYRKNLIRQLMEEQISLPEPVWARLNLAWIGFLATLGAANLIAVRLLSCNAWVSFKLYGLTGLMLLFVILQGLFMSRHLPLEPDSANTSEDKVSP